MVGGEAVIEERGDGSVVIELPVTNADGFRSFVLGFLDHAEVLSPPELRDDIVAWLRTIASASA
jgi:predicted DNA-binding transcriptional regulator YafY